jgi:signal transduction histidine kinase
MPVQSQNNAPPLVEMPSARSGESVSAPARAAVPLLTELVNSVWQLTTRKVTGLTDSFVPQSLINEAEPSRRARLISRFGFLGALFGLVYATFYFLIGHLLGAAIIVACSAAFALIPRLMQQTGSLSLAGNLLSLILTLGFTALCCIEGGVEGHAIAWLASVPLCALLLLGRKSAGWWVVVCFGIGTGIAMAQLLGLEMAPTYDHSWHRLVSAAGYLGLVLFLFLLGAIFEAGRERAFGKMREALDKLEVSNNQLTRLNQEKNEFLGIAAHDLKNPLTVVIGTAELLRLAKSDQHERLTGNIIGAGQRMLHLIKNLLDANAIEEGRFTSNLECCDLRALVRESLDNNVPAATRKEIVLRLESEDAFWAQADRNATMQILDNLISNAVKYSPRNTTVRVRLGGPENGKVFVAIKDEGPGLSAEDQQKLFRKFTRLTARPTGGESSTGLGLSIVKRLAEAMSGSVDCESTLGQGATFTLRLPNWNDRVRAKR